MANTEFKRNGTPLLSRLKGGPRMRTPVLCATLLSGLLLAGCVTTGSTGTSLKAQCDWTAAITYSAKKDTPGTVAQVRVHNRAGQRLGCWQ